MNDGILSLVLLIIFIFIFIGEWLTDEFIEANWKVDRVLFYLFLLMIAPYFRFTLYGLEFSILLLLIPLMIVLIMITLNAKEIIQSFFGGFFVAAVFNLFKELLSLDPILLFAEERMLFGLILGLLIGILNLPLKIKWIVSTLGVWLGLCYFISEHYTQLTKVPLFSYYDLDLLFSLYLCVTLMHLILNKSSQWIKNRTKRC